MPRQPIGVTRLIVGAAVILIVGLGLLLFSRWLRPLIQVTEPVQGPVVQAFYATGTVLPVREYPIKANAAETLTDVKVDKGDHVNKGEALAVASDASLQFALDQANADLHEKLQLADEKNSPVLQEFDSRLQAGNDLLDNANREHDRLKNAMAIHATSQTDLDQSQDRVKRAWSEAESIKSQRAAKVLELARLVEVSKSAVATAQWNVDQQTLRSPVDGVVLDRPASLGTHLAVNDHVMQVADVRPANLVMRAQVDEEDKTQLRAAQRVRLTLYAFAGRVFNGKVSRVYDKADTDRRTFEVDVTLDEPSDQLAPGMTGELTFVVNEKAQAMVLPSQALQDGAVYVVRDGRLTRSDALVGIRSIERIEILGGLKDGESVVISPVNGLRAGTSVRTQHVDSETAASLNKPKATGDFKGFAG